MFSIVYIIVLTAFWVVNLFNGTGLDSVYHVTEYARYIVSFLALACLILDSKKERSNSKEQRNIEFFVFCGMFVIMFLSSFNGGFVADTIDYIWTFVIVYYLSKLSLNDKVFKWVGVIYGVAGATVLYIYDYGTILSGWNENSIAMLGMHSYLVFIIPYFNKKQSIWNKLIFVGVTILYSVLLSQTNSRSGVLFMIVGALFVFNILSRKIVLNKNGTFFIVLLIPLIISLIVCIISKNGDMDALNAWSYDKFNKPLFNGRDKIWIYGFELLEKHLLIGTGDIMYDAWHNSAVTCLTTYGCIGYLFWILTFYQIIKKSRPYIDDSLVQGCVIAFFVLYVQQSVELGIISATPSIIAYVILGMMLGRIRKLDKYGAEDEYYLYER